MATINLEKTAAMECLKKMKNKELALMLNVAGGATLVPKTWDAATCPIPRHFVLRGMNLYAEIRDTPLNEKEALLKSMQIATVLNWRMDKTIYVPDRSLTALLRTQSDCSVNENIMTDQLNLPHPCIYVRTRAFPKTDGFFMCINENLPDHSRELFVLPVSADGNFIPYPVNLEIPLTPTKLADWMDYRLRQSELQCISEGYIQNETDRIKFYADQRIRLNFAINIILYLNSVNTTQRQIKKHTYVKTQDIKDVYTEIQAFAVGEGIGSLVREKVTENRKNGAEYEKPVGRFETFTGENGKEEIRWVIGASK